MILGLATFVFNAANAGEVNCSAKIVGPSADADGVRIPGVPWPILNIPTPEACAEECEKVPECNGFHSYGMTDPFGAGHCYLHKDVTKTYMVDDNRQRYGSICTGSECIQDSWDECNRFCECVNGYKKCRRVRKELQAMDREERARYWKVYLEAYNDPDGEFKELIVTATRFYSRGTHNNGAFLPWHRGFLLEAENLLQAKDCRVTIPYWDWAAVPRISSSNVFGLEDHQASSYRAQVGTRCVESGTFGSDKFLLTNGMCLERRIGGGAAANTERVETILSRYDASEYDSFRRSVEHGPGFHGSVNCLVGGTMCSARAYNEPLYFNHLAMVDRIWSKWQSRGADFQQAYTGNFGRDELMAVSRFTPAELLDNTNLPSMDANAQTRVHVHYQEAGDLSATTSLVVQSHAAQCMFDITVSGLTYGSYPFPSHVDACEASFTVAYEADSSSNGYTCGRFGLVQAVLRSRSGNTVGPLSCDSQGFAIAVNSKTTGLRRLEKPLLGQERDHGGNIEELAPPSAPQVD